MAAVHGAAVVVRVAALVVHGSGNAGRSGACGNER